jgi:hypothetical protein
MAYITLEDLRVEGLTSEDYPNDDYLEGRIALAQEFIEKVTGRFFESRSSYELLLDGTGHNTLYLPIPPINGTDAITEVTISDEVLDPTYYQYPLSVIPDGRLNPKLIKIIGIWPKPTYKNRLNIKVTGSFGFVESDGTIPPLIQYLCKKLVMWAITPITDASASRQSSIIEESLGDYRYKLSDVAHSGGFFGDVRIDNIVSMYRSRVVKAV